MIYLQLFLSFFKIGLFSFGGGYAAVPLIQSEMVEAKHWLEMSEYANVITIAGTMPGSIALNSATFVGQKVAGFSGAVVATIGCILPSFIIVLILSYVYMRFKNLTVIQGVLSGLRPAVVSMIASAGLSILILAIFNSSMKNIQLEDFRIVEFALFDIGLFLLRKFRINVIWIIFGSGIVGTIIYLIMGIPLYVFN
jgi:chromate transporter